MVLGKDTVDTALARAGVCYLSPVRVGDAFAREDYLRVDLASVTLKTDESVRLSPFGKLVGTWVIRSLCM